MTALTATRRRREGQGAAPGPGPHERAALEPRVGPSRAWAGTAAPLTHRRDGAEAAAIAWLAVNGIG